MRIGSNPNKNVKLERDDFFHQIVIPVYIPNNEGYFKDSFTVFKYNLESIFKTIHNKTFITIVNNGCSKDVIEYIDELYEKAKIHEIIHTTNVGKVNAVMKGIMGHKFPFVTITDSDVLFLNDWQKQTYTIFNAFPDSGIVGLTPILNMNYYLTANIFINKIFSKKLQFSKIKNYKAMLKFYQSIGREKDLIDDPNKRYFTLKNEKVTACVGSGHYVATFRGNVFETIDKSSKFKLGGDIVYQIDGQILRKGYWRMSTYDNYAYHMGNTSEKWMAEELKTLANNDVELNVNLKERKNLSNLKYQIVFPILFRIFALKWVRKLVENYKREHVTN